MLLAEFSLIGRARSLSLCALFLIFRMLCYFLSPSRSTQPTNTLGCQPSFSLGVSQIEPPKGFATLAGACICSLTHSKRTAPFSFSRTQSRPLSLARSLSLFPDGGAPSRIFDVAFKSLLIPSADVSNAN